ncbi:MAG: rRNA pseudouridine synthase [Clostridia bacterium]|nr:rRNA pseudouridine synthase [Clostridia bacterium]
MAEIRLQKYFTDCGVMSRRAAEAEIAAGKVKVNGVVAEVGCKIDPERDVVEYKGKKVKKSGSAEHTYILLNKPVGYVCTLSDEADRLTVADLIKSVRARVYPVGRLDMYSDGLLLMTDDGELTCRLTHPSHGFGKTYVAEIPGTLTDDDVYRIAAPIEIDGRMTMRAEARLLFVNGGKSYVEIVLKEGRNRQIRRMCESAGFKLTRLTRTKIGDIELAELPIGKWRLLTEDEINYLKGI